MVLDVGAGFGRHVFECARRGANVVALDYAEDEVVQTRATLGGMVDAGEIDIDRFKGVLRGDATRLPFADGSFDVVITSEVLGAHTERRRRDQRDGPGAQAGRHVRRDGSGVAAREGQLDAVGRVPRSDRRGWPRSHLLGHRAVGEAPQRRPRPARPPSRPRAALAVLVAEVRRRADEQRPSARRQVPRVPRVGHHDATHVDPDRRPGIVAGHRQEHRLLCRETGRRNRCRRHERTSRTRRASSAPTRSTTPPPTSRRCSSTPG